VEQMESLFDTGDSAWRLEIRVKGGGGPFDPAGYSVVLTSGDGKIEMMTVRKEESREWAVNQVMDCLDAAVKAFYNAAELKNLMKSERQHRFARKVFPDVGRGRNMTATNTTIAGE
jgi:hypothetical protein